VNLLSWWERYLGWRYAEVVVAMNYAQQLVLEHQGKNKTNTSTKLTLTTIPHDFDYSNLFIWFLFVNVWCYLFYWLSFVIKGVCVFWILHQRYKHTYILCLRAFIILFVKQLYIYKYGVCLDIYNIYVYIHIYVYTHTYIWLTITIHYIPHLKSCFLIIYFNFNVIL
jgi:hypothetical protein